MEAPQTFDSLPMVLRCAAMYDNKGEPWIKLPDVIRVILELERAEPFAVRVLAARDTCLHILHADERVVDKLLRRIIREHDEEEANHRNAERRLQMLGAAIMWESYAAMLANNSENKDYLVDLERDVESHQRVARALGLGDHHKITTPDEARIGMINVRARLDTLEARQTLPPPAAAPTQAQTLNQTNVNTINNYFAPTTA